MNTAVHRFPLSGGGKGLSQAPSPATAFATFDPNSASELLVAARSALSTADLLLNFVHNNRSIARQAGVETIIIEIFAVMQGESFNGVIDALEEAGTTGQPLNLSHGGLTTLRRIEALIAEASMNMRRFTDGDFSVMELSAGRAKAEADSQRAYLEMEERRLDHMRAELDFKEKNAQRQQEAVASLKSSLGYAPAPTPAASVNLAQADQKPSSDLSFLIPFAIIGAIAATAVVVVMVVKDK